MKTRIPIFCMIILSLVVFIPQASACSCAADRTIEDSFLEADNVIFSGTVTGIKEQQRTFLVTFEIDQSWKGIPDDITSINTMTSQSSSMCGYNFTANQSYLVEAYGKWDQTPQVSICDSTTLLDFAHEQISFLNKQPLVDSENIDERLEMTKEFLDNNEFEQAIILHTDIDYTSKHVVVTIASEEFTQEHTAEYYEENLENWIPFDTRIRVAKAAVAEDEQTFAFLDSVIIPSPDFDIETAFKVTNPDDCHGESRYGGAWEWIDGECIIADPPPDFKIIPRKYIFAAPLQQIKAGVALIDIQCNDGKNVVYKRDRMRAACVTQETENKLIFERGWATMRLGLPATDDLGRDLCGWYGGEWDNLPRQCHGLKYPLLCSMSGGDIIDATCFIPSTTGVAPVEPIRN